VQIVVVTDSRGTIHAPDLLARAEAVHRQLRPHLPADYLRRMREVFAAGAEMAVAVEDGEIIGLTVFRVIGKTHSGRELHCDDLVTDERRRSEGVGHALMEHMVRTGRERGCDTLALDSGTQRERAHRFYFREGLTIPSFHFHRTLPTR
jgi:GNAT superfamily N-acetyltransferase